MAQTSELVNSAKPEETLSESKVLLLLVQKNSVHDSVYQLAEQDFTQTFAATHVGTIAHQIVELPPDAQQATHAIVSLDHDTSIDDVASVMLRLPLQAVCFVTGLGSHFSDEVAVSQEAEIGRRLAESDMAVTVLRVGQTRIPREYCWAVPLLAETPRSTFVSSDELRELIVDVFAGEFASCPLTEHGRIRRLTLLGSNRPWRDVLSDVSELTIRERILRTAAAVGRLVGAGIALRAVLRWRNRSPERRHLDFGTIRPQSEADLLSLVHRHNQTHVAVCGYNNGVNHFGWKHAGRTVVPTTDSGCRIDVDGDSLTVDAGVTLKRAIDAIRGVDREFYVVPNYSYIALGTVFFVPVHGSGSEVSTLGDTIEWVQMYDPESDSIVEAYRGDRLFADTMYNMQSGLVLLRLRFRIRSIATYFVQQSEHTNASADEVWAMFSDPETSNIEIRKNKAASDSLQLSKYYTADSDSDNRLAVPRDQLGKLWDRLEENPVSAWLFHTLVRKLAFHVELFLRKDEFAVFWEHHKELPVSKIQLRFVRHDGMKHSPFCDEDCVSADLFMTKGRKDQFLTFIRNYLPGVRVNPGKQSM